MSAEPFAWWASLKHGGLLIAPSRLEKHFAAAIEPLPFWLDERLRRDLGRLDTDAADAARAFQESVLEKICLLDHKGGGMWTSGNNVPARWSFRSLTGEIVKPRRIWNGPNDAFLPVFVDDEKRIGIGRGRRSFARVVEWLRASGQKLALLTNNYQWRLVYAGLDHEAWVEWDTELWFQEGHPSLQIDALRILLAPEALTPPEEVSTKPGAEVKSPPLLAAIQETRRGQAELSAALGERVRESVELLIQSHAPVLGPLQEKVPPHELYRAATRIIMRMVVGLFAEARDLLPRYDALYHGSYGLQGLREQLERVSGDRLRNRFGAWPRVLALFRLIYDGSHHERLTIPRYGGGLFQPGDPNADDLIRRAIHVFETGCFDSQYQIMPDALVYEILQLLCFTTVAIRQGTALKPALVPVDFSDLSSEYIGILYEGLLDYELKRAAANDPVVFLNVGDQPALPLSRLESLNDKALADLVEKLKQKKKVAVGGDDDGDADEDESTDEDDESDDNEETLYATDSTDIGALVVSESAAEYGEDTSKRDARHDAEKQALDWCRKAVIAGGLVSKPRSKKPDALQKYEADVNA